MASLQKKGESWYCQFTFQGKRNTLTIGKVSEEEAASTAARVDYLLMRVRQRLLDVPKGMDIATFIEFDGKPPPPEPSLIPKSALYSELRQRYLETFSHGAIESNTLATNTIHLKHIAESIGDDFAMDDLSLSVLQSHVRRRQEEVSATTIKKEIDTLRSVWNWGCRMALTRGTFPSAGLVYPKSDEKLPFMMSDEIERRIKAGGDADELWECLYLTHTQIHELLDHVQSRKISTWLYPACAVAALGGARRSEIMRASPQDVDLASGIITIREKKRVKGSRTTRRVPLSTRLAAALSDWLPQRADANFLFGPGTKMMSPQAACKGFERAAKYSQWPNMRGWHVLRHSFISALASQGVDQRIIDDFVGHQTDDQRRRYRHLYPSTQQEAIRSVFG